MILKEMAFYTFKYLPFIDFPYLKVTFSMKSDIARRMGLG